MEQGTARACVRCGMPLGRMAAFCGHCGQSSGVMPPAPAEAAFVPPTSPPAPPAEPRTLPQPTSPPHSFATPPPPVASVARWAEPQQAPSPASPPSWFAPPPSFGAPPVGAPTVAGYSAPSPRPRSISPRALVAITAAIAVVAAGVGAAFLLRPGGATTASAGASTRPPASGAAVAGNAIDNVPDPAADAAATKAVEAASAPLPGPEGDDPVPALDETTPPKGTLTVGAASNLASKTIGAAGGTIEGGGLKLDFPGGAFVADTPVKVTQAPITAADFGGLVTPLTPLYTVEAGDADLATPVTVTLKATVPDGATAMAFYRDEATGSLTPLTPVSRDATSITAVAPHFSMVFGGTFDETTVSQVANSGFLPGRDDWEFTNEGSYVVPGGHCEGQTISAIWYYVAQRKAGAAAL
jgi:hypothetical protein